MPFTLSRIPKEELAATTTPPTRARDSSDTKTSPQLFADDKLAMQANERTPLTPATCGEQPTTDPELSLHETVTSELATYCVVVGTLPMKQEWTGVVTAQLLPLPTEDKDGTTPLESATLPPPPWTPRDAVNPELKPGTRGGPPISMTHLRVVTDTPDKRKSKPTRKWSSSATKKPRRMLIADDPTRDGADQRKMVITHHTNVPTNNPTSVDPNPNGNKHATKYYYDSSYAGDPGSTPVFYDQTAARLRAIADFPSKYPNHPPPEWAPEHQFMPKEEYWHENKEPTWTTHREATRALNGYPDDPYHPEWPWEHVPAQIGVDLCDKGQYWSMKDMKDVYRHQRNLRNEFGDLSPYIMVIFRGTYKHKAGRTVKKANTQVFHDLDCQLLMDHVDHDTKALWGRHVNPYACYKSGANLLQIQVAKQFDLKMCHRCVRDGLFSEGQHKLWDWHPASVAD
jgi:hypothetical protein